MRAHTHVPLAAILLIVGAVLCFTLLDAVVKVLVARYPVPLLVWARYGMQTLILLAWLAPRMGASLLRTRHFRLHLVRAALLPLSSLCFFSALRFLPLAETTAINYTAPVLVIVLAVLFLDERMTPHRIALVLACVGGMLLIVRPGSRVFHPATFLVLGSATFYGTFQIMTRKLAHEDSRVLLFYPALIGTLLLSLALPWYDGEIAMPWRDVALVALTGILGTMGHFMFILAFQRAPASALTPFTYVHLVWATLVGWIVFGGHPDAWTLAGMAVIAGSGLLLAVHERRPPKGAPPVPTAVD
jgi:drug/metabolite transporter (DMT)-like permease